MKIVEKKISISELSEDYLDDGEGGIFAFDNRLTVRPSYQREFVYKDKQRDAVIESIRSGYPLSTMYWSKTGDDLYEVLDGQQRTISVCSYINGDYSINHRFFHNLTEAEKKVILDYKVTVCVCDGAETEKLQWFRVINIAGEVLTSQELLNATYTGTWLLDAKKYFSKRNCEAAKLSDDYVVGNPVRQDLLEMALSWVAHKEGLASGQLYMAKHQHDKDASDLWEYWKNVIRWSKKLFPVTRKGITNHQDWGILYNNYHGLPLDKDTLEAKIKPLIVDDDVTKKSGVIPFVLSGNEKYLNIRAFTVAQKMKAYELQSHKCSNCTEVFEFEEMEGDHVTPWKEGGHTSDGNLQMLCRKCNREKGAK